MRQCHKYGMVVQIFGGRSIIGGNRPAHFYLLPIPLKSPLLYKYLSIPLKSQYLNTPLLLCTTCISRVNIYASCYILADEEPCPLYCISRANMLHATNIKATQIAYYTATTTSSPKTAIHFTIAVMYFIILMCCWYLAFIEPSLVCSLMPPNDGPPHPISLQISISESLSFPNTDLARVNVAANNFKATDS